MFGKIAAAIAGNVPGAVLAVTARLFSRDLMEWIIARLVVEGLDYFAARWDSEITQEIAAEVRRRLGVKAERDPPAGGEP